MSAGKHQDHHGPKHVHMLSGIVRCPGCGAPMYGTVNKPKRKDGSSYRDIFYYICRNAKKPTGTECSYARYVRAEKLDEDVAAVLGMAMESVDFTEEVKDAYGRTENMDALAGNLEKLREERKKLERRKSRLIGNIAELDADDDDQYAAMYADLQGVLRRINQDIAALDGRIDEAAIQLYNAKEGSLSQERLLSAVKEMVKDIGTWPPEQKRWLMHEFIDSVEILPESTPSGGLVKRVRFKFPMFPVTRGGEVRYSDFIDLKYDDDTPPDDDGPSGGSTPQSKDPPSGSGAPQTKAPVSDGGFSHTESFTPIQSIPLSILNTTDALRSSRRWTGQTSCWNRIM